jgi:hypothetical protein
LFSLTLRHRRLLEVLLLQLVAVVVHPPNAPTIGLQV